MPFMFINTENGYNADLKNDGYWPGYILTTEHDCIPDRIKTTGSWEQDLINDAKQYVTDNSIVLDIGANIGVWSVMLAKNKTVTIHAFEPYPPTYYNLCANVLVNESYNIHTYRCAVGSEEEHNNILPLFTLDGNIGATRLCEDNNLNKSQYTARMDYIDNIITEGHVSLIKIDVEGHEENALRGAEKLINRCRPVIFFESWCSEEHKEKKESLMNYLTSLNYSIVHIKYDDYKAIPN